MMISLSCHHRRRENCEPTETMALKTAFYLSLSLYPLDISPDPRPIFTPDPTIRPPVDHHSVSLTAVVANGLLSHFALLRAASLSGVEPLVGIDVGVPGLFGAARGHGDAASLGLGRGPWVLVVHHQSVSLTAGVVYGLLSHCALLRAASRSGVVPLVGIDVGVPGLFGAAGGVGNPASLGLGRGPWVAVHVF